MLLSIFLQEAEVESGAGEAAAGAGCGFLLWIVADGSLIVQRGALKMDHNYQQIAEL